jgi:hypothetical protein
VAKYNSGVKMGKWSNLHFLSPKIYSAERPRPGFYILDQDLYGVSASFASLPWTVPEDKFSLFFLPLCL